MLGCFGDCFGRKYSGRIMGTATLFGQGVGGALGPLFGGLVRDITGSYLPAFAVGAIAYFGAMVFIQIVRKPKQRAIEESKQPSNLNTESVQSLDSASS